MPKAPRSPQLSSYQQYHWIFGNPLIVLPKRKLSESDVVRHWLFISDCNSETPKKKSQTEKNFVIRKVIKNIVNHWKIQGIRPQNVVFLKLKVNALLASNFSVSVRQKNKFNLSKQDSLCI